MITIKSIGAEGFRAFRDYQETAELSPHGFFGIQGHNENTGGSSGAGKSSIAHIVAYLLGFSPFSANKQQSLHTKKPMQVWGVLDSPDGEVIIRRGKETSIQVGDESVITGSVNKVNERIEKLFGIPSDLLRNLTYRPQRKPGLFLSLADGDKKQFLSRVLGLEVLRKQIQDATKTTTKLGNSVDNSDAALKALTAVAPVKPDSFNPIEGADIKGVFCLQDELHRLLTVDAIEIKGTQKKLSLLTDKETELKTLQSNSINAGKLETENKCIALFNELTAINLADASVGPEVGSELDDLKKALLFADSKIAAFNYAMIKEKEFIQQERKKLSELERPLYNKTAIQNDLKRHRLTLESLNKQECPTCKQSWITGDKDSCQLAINDAESKLNQLSKLEIEITLQKDSLLQKEQAIVAPSQLSEYQQARENILGGIRKEERRQQQLVNDYRQKRVAKENEITHKVNELRSTLQQANLVLMEESRQKLSVLQDEITSIRNKIRQLEIGYSEIQQVLIGIQEKNSSMKKIFDLQNNQYEKYQKEYELAKSSYDKAVKELNLEKDLTLLLKGFLGSIFGEILDEIADETNSLLQGLPNVATTTIQFLTDKEKTDGSFDATITPVINRGGDILDLEANLSGGQLAAVELATDLAVSKVVQRRTGSAPGWLILDEAFVGFDIPVVESCLNLLSKAGNDLQIFIIDHSTETKDYFTNIIKVVSEDDISRIER